MSRKRIAVITTHERPQDFRDCLRSLIPQVDHITVVVHGRPSLVYVWDSIEPLAANGPSWQIIPYESEVPNISTMWNLGIDSAPYVAAGEPYDVAVLNDDIVLPPNWFEAVTSAMRDEARPVGCAKQMNDPRMAGYAFIIDGHSGIRADEQFQWWYGDDDIERQANALGGVAKVGGLYVEHRHPNSTTVGALAAVASEDKGRFERKWI